MCDTRENAATLIQKNFRGFLARKKYAIRHLQKNQQTAYPVFVISNDPDIPSTLMHYHEPNKKIALIATSGMRAISLACILGNRKGNRKNIPKIILVDNSSKVHAFWYEMRELAKSDAKAKTAKLFLHNLPLFLESQRFNKIINACSLEFNYFKRLIKAHGYDYMRAVISHTTLIKQSWADEDTFIKIKNILSYQGIDKIYVYPSNIAAYIDDTEIRKKILENISKLNPILSIHTDCCPIHHYPEKTYLFKNNNTSVVLNSSLFAPSLCTPQDDYRNPNSAAEVISKILDHPEKILLRAKY